MKRNYKGLKKATAFALMLGLTMQFTACGGAEKVEESNEVVEVTATPEPTEEVEETSEQESNVETNVAGYNEKLPDYEQTYMKFEEIEPTEMVAVKDAYMYSNPNMTEGKLVTDGSVLAEEERTITAKGEFDGKKYWAYKNDNNRWFIIEEDVLAVKGQEEAKDKAEPTPTETPADTSGNNAQPTATPVPTTPPAQTQATQPDEIVPQVGDDVGGGMVWCDTGWSNDDGSDLPEDIAEAAYGFTIE